jgi:Family of unknown function (DUF5989)
MLQGQWLQFQFRASQDPSGVRSMLSLIKELGAYMSARKKWWLLPVITILLIIGGLLVLAQGSAVAPFIYTVF